MTFTVSNKQAKDFHNHGLVLIENIITQDWAEVLKERYTRLFAGEFETGIRPDEVNWQADKSDPTLARQICNAWRADKAIARTVLRQDIACAIANLMGWNGTRIMQDNVIWKPPGTRSFNYHQDNSYLQRFDPGEICSVWIALDNTDKNQGTMELVPGSHRWGISAPEGEFHAPDCYRAPMKKRALELGVEPDIYFIETAKGNGSIHHGCIWHGSGPNLSKSPRRSLVIHAMPAQVRYRWENFSQGTGPVYARYARLNSDVMDENYFPILWRNDGYRTPGLDQFCEEE